MNAVLSPPCLRWLLLLVLGFCLCFTAMPVAAAESGAGASSGMTLHANVMMELVANRSRLIQVSLVCVVFGCALLWWKR